MLVYVKKINHLCRAIFYLHLINFYKTKTIMVKIKKIPKQFNANECYNKTSQNM